MFNEIIGHNEKIEQLGKELASNRLPNAYLFSGLKGIGKRKIADAFALAAVCQSASANNWQACLNCSACKKALAFSHPDILIVEPEVQQKPEARGQKQEKTKSENIKVEQIRELQSRLQFHPLEAALKIAIVDEADRMTESTANSLLKILEEPPTATHFILISAHPHLVLPTIRSRSRQIAFSPVGENEIAKLLVNKKGMTEKDALRIGKLSGGSVQVALSIDPEFVDETLSRFVALMKKGSSADIIQAAEGWSKNSPTNIRLFFEVLASYYRDCLRDAVSGEMSDQFSSLRIEKALTEVSNARRALDTTANKQLMFENLLFSLSP